MRMTQTQSEMSDTDLVQAQERMMGILTSLGKMRIPQLELGEFQEDINKTGSEGDGLETWEENIGVRLGLRIIDQVMMDQMTRMEELNYQIVKLSTEKSAMQEEVDKVKQVNTKLEEENTKMRKDIKKLIKTRTSSSSDKSSSSDPGEVESLRKENKKLKEKYSELFSKHNKLLTENNLSPPSSTSSALEASKQSSRKRKSPEPTTSVFDIQDESPQAKRTLSRKTSPAAADDQLNNDSNVPDTVPDTVPVAKTLPLPSSSSKPSTSRSRRALSKTDVRNVSVPDTPEKECNPSADIETFTTPEKYAFHYISNH